MPGLWAAGSTRGAKVLPQIKLPCFGEEETRGAAQKDAGARRVAAVPGNCRLARRQAAESKRAVAGADKQGASCAVWAAEPQNQLLLWKSMCDGKTIPPSMSPVATSGNLWAPKGGRGVFGCFEGEDYRAPPVDVAIEVFRGELLVTRLFARLLRMKYRAD